MKTLVFFIGLFVSLQVYSQSVSIDNKNAILFQQSFIICYGDRIVVDTNVYSKTGIYTNVLKSRIGVDSIVTTTLTVKPPIDVSMTVDTTAIFVNENQAAYQWIDCNNNNLPIASNNQWYNATANGGYAVIVTKDGCTDTSTCAIINLFTSGYFNDLSHTISVVPPINDGMFMVNSIQQMTSIVIVDVLGRVIYKNKPKDLRTMVTIKDEPSGVYFLCAATEGKQAIFKIEKQ